MGRQGRKDNRLEEEHLWMIFTDCGFQRVLYFYFTLLMLQHSHCFMNTRQDNEIIHNISFITAECTTLSLSNEYCPFYCLFLNIFDFHKFIIKNSSLIQAKGYVMFIWILSNSGHALLFSFLWSNELTQAGSVYDQMLGF